MKNIKLTQGQFALINDEDYEFINKYKWYAQKGKNTFYTMRTITIRSQDVQKGIKRKRKTILMHRVILERKLKRQLRSDEYADHINHRGLDNRRNNLRLCSQSENIANSIKHKKASSIYKGVSWSQGYRKWQAQIKINRESKHGGYFDSELDAAKAYNEMALKYFGEFAKLNGV